MLPVMPESPNEGVILHSKLNLAPFHKLRIMTEDVWYVLLDSVRLNNLMTSPGKDYLLAVCLSLSGIFCYGMKLGSFLFYSQAPAGNRAALETLL